MDLIFVPILSVTRDAAVTSGADGTAQRRKCSNVVTLVCPYWQAGPRSSARLPDPQPKSN